MQTVELGVVCSGIPGFIRSVGTELSGRFRLLECYSVPEAVQMVQMHAPGYLVVDLRNAEKTHCARIWALIQTISACRCVVVTNRGQLSESSIPVEVAGCVQIVEQATDETDLQSVAEQVRQSLTTSATASVETPPHDPDENSRTTERPKRSVVQDVDETDQSISDRYRTQTPDLRRMLERLQVAAQHDVTILLIGETGSGKTHLARLIHEASQRSTEPLVTVACGALPGELIESELFGHAKGSFTSAHADKDGKFISAGRGTILLDEIDVLTPEQQVKLLRVIETGQFEPVGSNTTLNVQARIIAASNLELQPLVETGRFRPDLYYRLNTLTFRIPPLRKRLADIEPLARYFVHLHGSRHGIEDLTVGQDLLQALLSYPWPGNVREMENAIRSAVIYSQNGVLSADTLPPHVTSRAVGPGNDSSVHFVLSSDPNSTLENRIELTEKDIIEQALLENSFSRTRTAKQLGISRVTLYNKMKKYDIMPKR